VSTELDFRLPADHQAADLCRERESLCQHATETYDIDYFIRKFEGIPEDQWTKGSFCEEDGRCCALGHCGVRNPEDEGRPLYTPEANALRRILPKVVDINDGYIARPEAGPKKRILAALQRKKAAWLKRGVK